SSHARDSRKSTVNELGGAKAGLEQWRFGDLWRRFKFAAYLLAVLPAFPAVAGDAFAGQRQNTAAQNATAKGDPHDFAVNIFRDRPQSWPGYGVYLGDGMVLSAAHVVGHSLMGNPSVAIAGRILEAQVVKEGEFETVDLTLLRIDVRQLPPSLGLRLMPICESVPLAGQPVIVVTPQAVSTSHILSPKALPSNLQGRFDTLIADVATTGN